MTNQTIIAKKGDIGVGDHAPDFTLPDQTGKPFHFGDLIGKGSIVLYFYPKDNSSVCTTEACAFRDSFEVFKQEGATVIGVSDDSAESHAGFAQKHRLPFTLLSDTKGTVRKLYGVPKAFGILPGRMTYIIDDKGIVQHTFYAIADGVKHVTEAIRVLRLLKSGG